MLLVVEKSGNDVEPRCSVGIRPSAEFQRSGSVGFDAKQAAAFSSQKICEDIAKSMEFRSSTRFDKISFGTACP
jgi:hypothetical protein